MGLATLGEPKSITTRSGDFASAMPSRSSRSTSTVFSATALGRRVKLVKPGPATAGASLKKQWRCCGPTRSEEHTSELQSQSNLVCRLLLATKKTEDALWPSTYISPLSHSTPCIRQDRISSQSLLLLSICLCKPRIGD